ncbi:MAG: hypothetical protein LBQ77_00975 [Treponema sp.]|jgi:hypothetical protein|nr:hypothetical protein [Treponema sp.]
MPAEINQLIKIFHSEAIVVNSISRTSDVNFIIPPSALGTGVPAVKAGAVSSAGVAVHFA